MTRSTRILNFRAAALWVLAALLLGIAWQAAARAQNEPPEGPSAAERRAAEALNSAGENDAEAAPEGAAPAPNAPPPELNLLELFLSGGPLLIPIVLMSLLVAVFGIERSLAIRRRKVMPADLVEALGEASGSEGGLDPRKVYKICQRFPSAASNVLRAAMLKVGRPHAEVEHTVKDASEREAEKLYANVRPLTLAAAVSPLLGLLGTVWGMIIAFFETASGTAQVNKAEQLADGIYTALVTTFAGLAVAIPAAVLAHWFEGRIQTLFREIDELLLNMLPQLERYEGKLRVHRQGSKSRRQQPRDAAEDEGAPAAPPLAAES